MKKYIYHYSIKLDGKGKIQSGLYTTGAPIDTEADYNDVVKYLKEKHNADSIEVYSLSILHRGLH